jgi:hypothetical protein
LPAHAGCREAREGGRAGGARRRAAHQPQRPTRVVPSSSSRHHPSPLKARSSEMLLPGPAPRPPTPPSAAHLLGDVPHQPLLGAHVVQQPLAQLVDVVLQRARRAGLEVLPGVGHLRRSRASGQGGRRWADGAAALQAAEGCALRGRVWLPESHPLPKPQPRAPSLAPPSPPPAAAPPPRAC